MEPTCTLKRQDGTTHWQESLKNDQKNKVFTNICRATETDLDIGTRMWSSAKYSDNY